MLWIWLKDSSRAGEVLRRARKFATKKEAATYPAEEGTLALLDELIHDCRQYLMMATGELKSIEEEGTLALEDPTSDIWKITIRLKRLKDQCVRLAGKTPLDWIKGGGL